MPTALSLLQKALSDMGADGLCNCDESCGCDLSELSPCGCMCEDCEAARWVKPASDSPDFNDEFPDGYYKVMPGANE